MTTSLPPSHLDVPTALRIVRRLAADSSRIVVVAHGRRRARERVVTRREIERCLQKGSVSEGPYVAASGNWRLNMFRHAAGEQLTCVVEIEWERRLIVVTVIR